MDTFGQVYLGFVIVAVVTAIVGFWFLSRRGPRGSVLVVAAALYFTSYTFEPGQSRELVGLLGVLRITGFIGGVLGVFDLVRRRESPGARPRPEKEDQG